MEMRNKVFGHTPQQLNISTAENAQSIKQQMLLEIKGKCNCTH